MAKADGVYTISITINERTRNAAKLYAKARGLTLNEAYSEFFHEGMELESCRVGDDFYGRDVAKAYDKLCNPKGV